MKRIQRILGGLLAIALSAPCLAATDMQAGMKEGNPGLKSMGPLAFGPEGVLFVADTKSAVIVAIATGDTTAGPSDRLLKIDGLNEKLAAMLGTTADQVLINDMVVNPISRSTYLALSRGRGPDAIPVLARAKRDGTLEVVPTDKVKFSRTELPAAPSETAATQRQESITDIAFMNDRVVVAGLSNEEFSSSLRSIAYPFAQSATPTAVEIFHGAHGRFETRAPVRTFVSINIGDQPQLLAAYTCTPLVQIPMSDLKPGAKVRGKTIAELGNRNRPIDMIVYQKDGKDYLLLANSSRGIMKLSTDGIAKAESITEPVTTERKGLPYDAVAWSGVTQLDRFDADHAVVLRSNGAAMSLEALPLP